MEKSTIQRIKVIANSHYALIPKYLVDELNIKPTDDLVIIIKKLSDESQ